MDIKSDEIFTEAEFPALAIHKQSLPLTYPIGEKPPRWDTPCVNCPCNIDNIVTLNRIDPVGLTNKHVDKNVQTDPIPKKKWYRKFTGCFSSKHSTLI